MKLTNKAELHELLGTYLKNKRIEAGYTQAEIAKKLGYSTPQFISNFERGLCSPPLKNLKVLVKMYNIPAEHIIDLILKEQESLLRKTLANKKSKKRAA